MNLSTNNKATSLAEKQFRATVEGQKAMCGRASRIATLHLINEKIRIANPAEAYHRNLIDSLPESQIEGMLDSLIQDYNKLVVKPALS